MTPPISAAAMLSRKPDTTHTMPRSASGPIQLSGRKRGITSGAPLSSKWRDSTAKPRRRRRRFERMIRSCHIWARRPPTPGPGGKPVKMNLYTMMIERPVTATVKVRWWKRATERSVAPNRKKSTGTPKSLGPATAAPPAAAAASAGPANKIENIATMAPVSSRCIRPSLSLNTPTCPTGRANARRARRGAQRFQGDSRVANAARPHHPD